MFRVKNRTFHYQVCHFGGRFSAYWWSRVAALLIRLLHHSVFTKHGGWIYVDDFLWALPRSTSPALATMIALLLVTIGCPISWDKAVLNRRLTWIGWDIDLRLGIVQATQKNGGIKELPQNVRHRSENTNATTD